MLAAERHEKILELARKQGSVLVDELSKELDVSAMTIRRDLVKLQEEGLLERCHGGAVAKKEVTYADKQVINIEEKETLAAKAASFVKPGETIFLDAGTTTFEIAKQIRKVPDILIVTNDLEIARLMMNGEAEVVLCGGTLQKSTGSMLGYYATQMLQDFQFDVGFFGAASISEDFQVMTPTLDKAFLKREAACRCENSFLVVDESKFGKQSIIKINHLADYTSVITNRKFGPGEQEKLDRLGAEIITV